MRTWAELARELRISPQLLEYHKKRLGSPHSKDPEKWHEYLQAHHKTQSGTSEDLLSAKVDETRARAALLEMEKRQLDGELVKLDEVQRLISRVLLPIRQRLNALPAECASQVNPTDPVFARQALQRWVDESLPMIRAKLK